MIQETKQWRKFTGEWVKDYIEEEVKQVLLREKKMGHQLSVCIGTDSQVKGPVTEFATVIVFVRKGCGAFMYLNSEISRQKMNIRQRMLQEVNKSVAVAYLLSNLFISHNVSMEVHVDINTLPCHKSNEALKEAMGYITGMGFAFKAKPDAFASSCCANKVVQ